VKNFVKNFVTSNETVFSRPLQHKLGPNFYESGRHMMQLIGSTDEADEIGKLLVRATIN
jgi:hypothetical protein